jgi:OOP family OmpA-OmpF porin
MTAKILLKCLFVVLDERLSGEEGRFKFESKKRRETMKKIISLVVILMMTCIVATGYAQVRHGSFDVTPYIGFYKFEGNEDMDSSIALGMRLGYNVTKYFGIEGYAHWVPTRMQDYRQGYNPTVNGVPPNVWNNWDIYDNTGQSMSAVGYGIEGVVNLLPDRNLVPFVAAGIGGIYYSRACEDTTDNRYNKFAVSYGGGLKWFFAENWAVRGDVRHVMNFDSFHNNLMGTIGLTYAFGGKRAAAPAPAPEPAAEAIEKGRTTLDVKFDLDKAIIKKGYYGDIDNLVSVMKQYPETNVALEGHTCSLGSDAYNKRLSQRRADAVKQYMVEKGGIAANRLNAIGYGEERPIASNATEEGRRQNRRTEAVVEYLIKK